MEDYGLVSIITPTWNCGRFISETIESVLSQTYSNWEMIICDDCSTDGTYEIVSRYIEKEPRIKYLCNKENKGAALTRNRALCEAGGRWIAFLDSDDLWQPEKLEKQLRFMVNNNYAFTYHEYTEMSEDGSDLGIYVSGKRHVRRFDMYACCWPGCLSVMYDASIVGLVQIRDIKKNNDTALWLKVIKKTDCYLLKDNLARYRRRKGSITPPSISKRVMWHYRLFREAEEMNPVLSFIWMIINVFGNTTKKLFYVKSI